MFEKVFIINLKFKTDRLEKILATLPKSIGNYEVWPAIHGDTVKPPSTWHAGNGAWGCWASHMGILQHCYANGVESYLVLEDDAVFTQEFDSLLRDTLLHIPNDWQQLYLGGHLQYEIKNPPKKINDYIYMPYNVDRTHCFAVHQRGYRDLYNHLYSFPYDHGDHIDHRMGRLHEKGKFAVYTSRRWIVGQDAGPSNIGKFNEKVNFWAHPEDCAKDHWLFHKPVCVFLETAQEIAVQLQASGWHQGEWRNEHGLDKGVCEALSHFYPEIKLTEWYSWVQREVVRDNKTVPCLYHPRLNWDLVSGFGFANWIHIKGSTYKECVDALTNSDTWKAVNNGDD